MLAMVTRHHVVEVKTMRDIETFCYWEPLKKDLLS